MNRNIDFSDDKEYIQFFEGFIYFDFADDDFQLFIFIERNEIILNCRFDMMISRVIFAMKFKQIIDIECII